MTDELNNMNLDEEEDLAPETVVLTLEDDTELECMVLSVFPAGGNDYIALLPISEAEDEDEAEGDILLYRYVDNGDDEPDLQNIESDEEYEMAADAFDELLDEFEYEDEDEDEEE